MQSFNWLGFYSIWLYLPISVNKVQKIIANKYLIVLQSKSVMMVMLVGGHLSRCFVLYLSEDFVMKSTMFLFLSIIILSPVFAFSSMLEYQSMGLSEDSVFHFAPNTYDGKSIPMGQINVILDTVISTGFCANAEATMGTAAYEVNAVDISTVALEYRQAGYLMQKYYQSATTSVLAAALQVAIWETINDTGYDATSGSLWIGDNDPVATAANVYLADLVNFTEPTNVLYYQAVNSARQDFMIVENTLPEPATIAFMVLGAVVLMRKKLFA